jgi:hypothetical protein
MWNLQILQLAKSFYFYFKKPFLLAYLSSYMEFHCDTSIYAYIVPC